MNALYLVQLEPGAMLKQFSKIVNSMEDVHRAFSLVKTVTL